jgi:hypothetical protein
LTGITIEFKTPSIALPPTNKKKRRKRRVVRFDDWTCRQIDQLHPMLSFY